MFGSRLWHSLMTCGKNNFRSIHSTRKYMEFSFVELNYEYVMVARLKEIYRANTIASSIFLVGGTQA